MARLSSPVPITNHLRTGCDAPSDKRSHNPYPATMQLLHTDMFRLFPLRSPLLGESIILSLPADT